jgi:hypothetical protein
MYHTVYLYIYRYSNFIQNNKVKRLNIQYDGYAVFVHDILYAYKKAREWVGTT